MQVCTSLHTDNHASIPPLSFLEAGCPSCRPTNSVKALKTVYLAIVDQIMLECVMYNKTSAKVQIFKKILTGTHTLYTHPFNCPFSGTTQVSRYQKGKTNLDFTEARDSEWQWHQLGHMQVCTSFQTDNHASTPPLSFFTGRMHFLPPNQQCQSTDWQLIRKHQWLFCFLNIERKSNCIKMSTPITKFNEILTTLSNEFRNLLS